MIAGQSNMALPLIHSYTRNESRDAITAGQYSNIRIHQLKGNMNPDTPWSTLKQALANTTGKGDVAATGLTGGPAIDAFMGFSASCYYYGE